MSAFTAALVVSLLAAPAGFGRGVDVSSLAWREPEIASARLDAFRWLRARGVDWVRLRVWHTPERGECGAAQALTLARRAHAAGLRIMLTLHYSDTWADPSRQQVPSSWRGRSDRVLADSVRTWTRSLLADFVRAGVAPAWVQLGNEITAGMLWPSGRLEGPHDAAGRRALARLLAAARRGAREGSASTQVLLHFDRGGDPRGAEEWFAERIADGVRPDVLALSYYPWWHGPLDSLAATLTRLERFDRPVMIVETAHPWTLSWTDHVHNVVGSPWRDPDRFGATPSGQHAFLVALDDLLRTRPNVAGWCYWEPLDISGRSRGSAWENLTIVDTLGVPLPAWEVYSRRGP